MNLFFLATFPNPHKAGAPRGGYRRNMEMLQLLTAQFKVSLVIAANEPFTIDSPDGVEAVTIAQKRMPLRWLHLFLYLWRHCPKTTPLICYNPSLHTFPVLWLKWLGWRVIVDYVDLQGTVVESKRPYLRRLSKWIEKQFIRSCHEFITSSTQIAWRVHQENPQAAVHMLRGTFRYQPTANNAAPPDLPTNSVKIMYLGMMQPFSGVQELLNAFIQTTSPNAHLYIVGHGPSKATCEEIAQKLAPDTVSFPTLDDAALHPFMRQMDILTVPYLDVERNWYNFPSKIIEYLWAGKAILGTNVGEIEQALAHGRTAWLVDPNEAAIAAGLKRLLTDNTLRHQLGQNACAEFEATYQPEIVSHTLTQFIGLRGFTYDL